MLTLMVLRYLRLFFMHLKLELLTQFPAPNDENIYIYAKNIRLQNVIIRLTKHLPQNISASLIYLQFTCKLIYIRFWQDKG